MSTMSMFGTPLELEGGIKSHGTGVTGGCEPPHGCGEPTQQVLLATESALQPPTLALLQVHKTIRLVATVLVGSYGTFHHYRCLQWT